MKNENDNERIHGKHAALFKNYLRILKSHGDLAIHISRNKLYEEACKPFFITAPVAGRIIRKLIKKPPNEILMDEEFEEIIKSGMVK